MLLGLLSVWTPNMWGLPQVGHVIRGPWIVMLLHWLLLLLLLLLRLLRLLLILHVLVGVVQVHAGDGVGRLHDIVRMYSSLISRHSLIIGRRLTHAPIAETTPVDRVYGIGGRFGGIYPQ